MTVIPVMWQLGIRGSGDVKSELDRLSEAFNKAKQSGIGVAKSQRELSSAVNLRLGQDRLQNRLLQVQYPNLLKVSRAMSTVSSITRTLLTLQNALNISKLVSQGADSQLLTTQHDINEERRLQAELIKQGLQNSPEYLASKERENILLQQQKDRIQDLKDSNFNQWIIGIEGVIITAGVAWKAFVKDITNVKDAIFALGGILPSIGRAFTGFFSNPALSQGLAFFASQFLDLIPGMKELKAGFADWLRSWAKVDATFLDTAMTKFFKQDIPLAIGQANVALTQFFLTDLPTWATQGMEFLKNVFITTWNSIVTITNTAINGIISGVESLANSFISVINRMISAYNRVAKKIGLGTLARIEGISLPRINVPLITAAKGFDGMVNQPTMFLAGEAGSEQVSITPHGQSRNNTTVIINNHIEGSVWQERTLFTKLDNMQKQRLKGLGFTGY